MSFEHVVIIKPMPYYTMPYDYIDGMTGRGRELLWNCRTFDHNLLYGNYLTELGARRINQMTNGMLEMLELEKAARKYTEKELRDLCLRKACYRKVYNQVRASA